MIDSDLSPPENFDGITRLFPLPNLVLFPLLMQALHIFEPRYRQMTADALAGDRLISLVLLRPGWEAQYEGRPSIAQIACLGRIVTEQRLDDGRYNLQLRGLSRIRIVHELYNENLLYRTARVELLEDTGLPAPDRDLVIRRQLRKLFPRWCPAKGPIPELFDKMLQSGHKLGTVCDVFAFTLPVSLEFRQELLETLDVGVCADKLIDYLKSMAPFGSDGTIGEGKFPPNFSSN